MKGFEGNKTLLPLVPSASPYEGNHPILLEILKRLPLGPKAVVVNYKKEDVIAATCNFNITYCEQPQLNGTGGALLAVRPFLEDQDCENLIVTMGDVPLVKPSTYQSLARALMDKDFVVLGFCPASKKQYGVLEIQGNTVRKIIEWKYWKDFSKQRQQALSICNSGIYAAKRETLVPYLSVLASRPHRVSKEVNGKPCHVEEFFITDLVEYIVSDGLPVGYVIAEDDTEVMGVDNISALQRAQEIFRSRCL